MKTRIKNISIKSFLLLLAKLNKDYDTMNLVIEEDNKTILIEPVIYIEPEPPDPLSNIEEQV